MFLYVQTEEMIFMLAWQINELNWIEINSIQFWYIYFNAVIKIQYINSS